MLGRVQLSGESRQAYHYFHRLLGEEKMDKVHSFDSELAQVQAWGASAATPLRYCAVFHQRDEACYARGWRMMPAAGGNATSAPSPGEGEGGDGAGADAESRTPVPRRGVEAAEAAAGPGGSAGSLPLAQRLQHWKAVHQREVEGLRRQQARLAGFALRPSSSDPSSV